MTHITTFGELLVDLIGESGDSLSEVSEFRKRPGGAPANVAAGTASLGLDVQLVASVGDDSFGDFLVDEVAKNGVGTVHISRSESHTTLAFAALDEDARPDFMFYRENAADTEIEFEQLEVEDVTDTEIFHFGSLSLTTEPVRSTLFSLLEHLEEDVKVTCDPNYRGDLWTGSLESDFEDALLYVDHLKVSEEELEILSEGEDRREQALNLMESYGIESVAVTRGPEGSEEHTISTVYSAGPVTSDVVDTTGAGDAFLSGYLTGLAEDGLEGEEHLRFANAVASCAIEEYGAMTALPSRDEVERRLEKSSSEKRSGPAGAENF
ncbi:MAG: carbohydrate kinase [Candidatus Nanohaloarchaeota archaeon QJJ-7]|nr:carbohydrate kinase [Candidatus Nanohaloarchaeota archaeon QJJ-7]